MNIKPKKYTIRNITVLTVILTLLITSVLPIQTVFALEYDFQGRAGTIEGGKEYNRIKMLEPSDITVESFNDDGYVNQINTAFDSKEIIDFKFIMSAGQNNFNEANFLRQSMPEIKVYNEDESKIVAQYSAGSGKLKYREGKSNTGDNDNSGHILIGLDAGTLDKGNYVLYFGSSIGGNNADKILGVYIKFKFTVKGLTYDEGMGLVNELTAAGKVCSDGAVNTDDSAWGKYPESAKNALIHAANDARLIYEDPDKSDDEKKEAVSALSDAIDLYKASRYVRINSVNINDVPGSVNVGDSGKLSATVTADPNEDQYKKVTWTASDNISIDKNTGAWQVNVGGDCCITATAVTSTSGLAAKQTDSWQFNVSKTDGDGMLLINLPSRLYTLQDMVAMTGQNPSSITDLKITATQGTSLTTDEVKYIKQNMTAIKKLDIRDSRLTTIAPTLFINCKTLEKIVLPTGTTSIGVQAFSGCTKLSDITLPPALTAIDEKAFENCTSLPDTLVAYPVKPPNIFTITGRHSFEGSSVNRISVPYSCREDYANSASWGKFSIIERPEIKLNISLDTSGTFEQKAKYMLDQQGLKEEDVNTLIISTENGAVFTRNEDHAYLAKNFIYASTLDMGGTETQDQKCNSNYFKDRVSLKNIVLPPDTTTIGSSAFSGCINLQNIKLPSNISKIGSGAFSGCRSLSEAIVIDAVDPPEYDGSPFNPDVVRTFIVPVQSVSKYAKAPGWSAFKIEPQIKVKLSASYLTMYIAESRTITAGVTVYSDNDKGITWSSSNAQIAKVDANGKITTIRPGTVDIIATTVEGGMKTICRVTVKAYNGVALKIAKRTYNSQRLSWNGISGVSGYEVYRSTSRNGTYSRVISLGSSSRSYISNGLRTGTTYYYKVRAYKTVSGIRYQGNFSNVAAAKPSLSRPTRAKAKALKGKKAKITWKKVSGASGYTIYRSTKKTRGFKAIKSVSKRTSKYTNKKLKKGKKYYYKIRAYRKVNGKKVYSSYSTVKSCRAK